MDEVAANMQDMMAIPGPCEDDDWSDNDFDGYVESERPAHEGSPQRDDSDERLESMEQERLEDDGGIPKYICTPGCTKPVGAAHRSISFICW